MNARMATTPVHNNQQNGISKQDIQKRVREMREARRAAVSKFYSVTREYSRYQTYASELQGMEYIPTMIKKATEARTSIEESARKAGTSFEGLMREDLKGAGGKNKYGSELSGVQWLYGVKTERNLVVGGNILTGGALVSLIGGVVQVMEEPGSKSMPEVVEKSLEVIQWPFVKLGEMAVTSRDGKPVPNVISTMVSAAEIAIVAVIAYGAVHKRFKHIRKIMEDAAVDISYRTSLTGD